jgi:hypothetical protein
MKNLDHLSPRDLERLSAYLDGELSRKEADNLDARLRREPDLRQALEELRSTATLLRALPEVPPPRDFALTAEMVGVSQRRPYPVLRLATALASLAFVALVGLDAITSALPLAGSMAPDADMRDLGLQEETVAEAPMMAAEPGTLPAEDDGTGDEQEGFFGAEPSPTQMLPMTEEAVERSENQADESGAPPEEPEKCCVKSLLTTPTGTGIEEPVPADGEAPVETEPAAPEPERARGLLAGPAWRIGLRVGEVLFGLAAIVMGSFMLWARRK